MKVKLQYHGRPCPADPPSVAKRLQAVGRASRTGTYHLRFRHILGMALPAGALQRDNATLSLLQQSPAYNFHTLPGVILHSEHVLRFSPRTLTCKGHQVQLGPNSDGFAMEELGVDARSRESFRQRFSASARVGNISTDIRDYSTCLLYTSPSPRDKRQSRMPSSA